MHEIFSSDHHLFAISACLFAYGAECPIALRMVACMLMMEITAFLRETYQSLPKSCRNSARDRPPPWERMYTTSTANRRWSMALSSMGHSQTSAQSLQSIAGDKDAGKCLHVQIRFFSFRVLKFFWDLIVGFDHVGVVWGFPCIGCKEFSMQHLCVQFNLYLYFNLSICWILEQI